MQNLSGGTRFKCYPGPFSSVSYTVRHDPPIPGDTETSRWSLKDNKLTISYDDGYSDVLTVNELTATKLVLAFEDWDTMDDGSEELDV